MADGSIWPLVYRFHITRDDYAAMNRAQVRLSLTRRSGIARLATWSLGMILILVALITALSGERWQHVAVTIVPAFAIALAILYVIHGPLYAWLYYNTFRVDKGEQQLALSPDALASRSERFEGKSPWNALHAVTITDAHVIFWVSPMQGHILSVRHLADGDLGRIIELAGAAPEVRDWRRRS